MADLATLTDFKTYLGPTHSGDDGRLTYLLGVASQFFESQCGRTFAQAAHTETQNGNDRRLIVPRHYPLVTVTSLKIAGETIPPAPDAVTSGYYTIDNVIYLRGYRASGLVEITYTAGYSTTIPKDISQAVVELAALKYREAPHIGNASESHSGVSVSFLPSLIPLSVKAVIDSYKRPGF